MKPLLTSDQMREAESYASKSLAVPELLLMEHAALAVTARIHSRFHSLLPQCRGILVAGVGNNGGDAIAVARMLFHKGCAQLLVLVLGDKKKMTEATALQLRMLGKLGIAVSSKLDEASFEASDFIVDGMFGIGLSRDVKAPFSNVIELINSFASKKYVVAVDIPSGLQADTGRVLGIAVQATETVTFGFLKRGLVTGNAADYVGNLFVADIQIPREIRNLKPSAFLYGDEDAGRLPTRNASGHKGNYGHIFVWGGKDEKAGASAIACLGAMKAGSGLVTLLGSRLDGMPIEIMTAPKRLKLSDNAVLAIGPGMGVDEKTTLREALDLSCPLVLDADALTILSQHADLVNILKARKAATVLTPHPKEAARLLGVETDAIQADRFAACEKLVDKFRCATILKGKGTLVGIPSSPLIVVNEGDSGLSKGGTGDLLTGIVASFLGQGLPTEKALPLAIFVHGRASVLVSQHLGTSRSTLASDIAEAIPSVFKELECRRGQ